METARLISFSGGKSSALMLKMICDIGIRDTDFVLFANTGKEREETLEFVHKCSIEFGVSVTWLEYDYLENSEKKNKHWFKEVTFETASRNGEPFQKLIDLRGYAPNPMSRYCTQELKIRITDKFMRSKGRSTYDLCLGIRYDEQRRVAKLRGKYENDNRVCLELPLFKNKVTKQDVLGFWQNQKFNLQLKDHEGNCDLCFLKARNKLVNIIKEDPSKAEWWANIEKDHDTTFRKGVRFVDLLALSQAPEIFEGCEIDELTDCFCN